jgi:transcription elongation GreA/GreB family factor
MTKHEIHQHVVDQLQQELEGIRAAAKASYNTATDQAHQAENKYDTFSLESSYLARGQARRVEELTTAIDRLRVLPLKELDDHSPIVLSALIRLEADDGEIRLLLLGPAGGGESVEADGQQVTIITSASPMGRALLGKFVGHSFTFPPGPDGKKLRVTAVS